MPKAKGVIFAQRIKKVKLARKGVVSRNPRKFLRYKIQPSAARVDTRLTESLADASASRPFNTAEELSASFSRERHKAQEEENSN